MSFNTIAQSANSGISNARAYLDDKANTLLKPKSAKGISGFLFDIPDQQNLTLSSDITDHFTESNSFLNDQIVRKPIIITLTGFIGELVYEKPDGIAGAIQELDSKLETVEAYAGDLTPGAVQIAQRAVQQVQSAVSAINQTLDKIQNVVGFFDGEEPEPSKQEKAYNELFALWQSSELLTVQTPWRYYDNMAIQTISFTQNGDSEFITDISVTLKEMRIAEIKTVDYDQNQFPPREEIQAGDEEDQGIVRGQDRNVSFLFSTFGGE